jgi:hypothetical protein
VLHPVLIPPGTQPNEAKQTIKEYLETGKTPELPFVKALLTLAIPIPSCLFSFGIIPETGGFLRLNLKLVEDLFPAEYSLLIEVQDRPGVVTEIRSKLAHSQRIIHRLGVEKDLNQQRIFVEATLQAARNELPEQIVDVLSDLQGVERIKIC